MWCSVSINNYHLWFLYNWIISCGNKRLSQVTHDVLGLTSGKRCSTGVKQLLHWMNNNSSMTCHTTHTHTHTTVLPLFWNMSGTTWVSRYQKGKTRQVKTNLDLLEQEIVSGSGICWAICKVCTSSQTTTPTSHHSVFLQAWCPSCCPTNSVKALNANV